MAAEIMSSAPKQEEIIDFITGWLGGQLGQPVLAEANFGAIGMDSLDAVGLIDALADKLGLDELPVSLVLDHPSAAALAAYLESSASAAQ
jgi:acyl carrier protein